MTPAREQIAPPFEFYSRCSRCGDTALFMARPQMIAQGRGVVSVWQWRCAKCGNAATITRASADETPLPAEVA